MFRIATTFQLLIACKSDLIWKFHKIFYTLSESSYFLTFLPGVKIFQHYFPFKWLKLLLFWQFCIFLKSTMLFFVYRLFMKLSVKSPYPLQYFVKFPKERVPIVFFPVSLSFFLLFPCGFASDYTHFCKENGNHIHCNFEVSSHEKEFKTLTLSIILSAFRIQCY